jgi:hypothetical protein
MMGGVQNNIFCPPTTSLARKAYELAEEVRLARVAHAEVDPKLEELQQQLQQVPGALKLLEGFILGDARGESLFLTNIFKLPIEAWFMASQDREVPQDQAKTLAAHAGDASEASNALDTTLAAGYSTCPKGYCPRGLNIIFLQENGSMLRTMDAQCVSNDLKHPLSMDKPVRVPQTLAEEHLDRDDALGETQ